MILMADHLQQLQKSYWKPPWQRNVVQQCIWSRACSPNFTPRCIPILQQLTPICMAPVPVQRMTSLANTAPATLLSKHARISTEKCNKCVHLVYTLPVAYMYRNTKHQWLVFFTNSWKDETSLPKLDFTKIISTTTWTKIYHFWPLVIHIRTNTNA